MGQLDQFAKDTFARETLAVTHGAVAWQLPPELGMSEVHLDGLLRVLDPGPLVTLAAPWPLAGRADELVLEIKMPGDHVDLLAFDRALLRRMARQVQRREDGEHPFDGEVPLWFVAPHVPAIIQERRPLSQIAPGCYRVGPEWLSILWIAANELPLVDELVPFLVARSGKHLNAFVQWVKPRRPVPWLLRMLQSLPMASATYDDLYGYVFRKSDDPEIHARQIHIAEGALDAAPEVREKVLEQGVEQGELRASRGSLRDVLDTRGLSLGPNDEARIDACADLDTLRRWLKQAVVAATVAEALR